ncbi:MAG TPA: peptidoglycan-binding protein LysM [Chromatiales bacterium]|nr:peptidoglycan-binding protein LysM [Chromatiales bacterium]
MGLFDFVKDIGKKIFGKEEEAPEALKQHIEKDNPGVHNLQIAVKEGVATVKGEADSTSAREKVILMVGNALGIREVVADELTVSSVGTAPESAEEAEFYVIEKGDTLSAIAKRFYGDANKYPLIFEANREVIQDPNLIFPGQKIRIPKQS